MNGKAAGVAMVLGVALAAGWWSGHQLGWGPRDLAAGPDRWLHPGPAAPWARRGLVRTLGAAHPDRAIGVDARVDGLRDQPGWTVAWLRQQERLTDAEYGPTLRRLGLAPEVAAEVRHLLIERRETSADARDAAAEEGLEGPEAKLAARLVMEGISARIEALVGADRYAQLQAAPGMTAYEDLLLEQIGPVLDGRGEPLSDEQLYQLGKARSETQTDEAFLARIGPLLSPIQLAAVEASLQP